jgi:CBS domain-containing protein
VSNIQRQPSSPQAEFLITIVGPITSIVLGGIFIWSGGLIAGSLQANVDNPAQMISQLSPTATLLLWLGWINVLVGIFNMIPGFPLDGGRILRSILWAITDNLRQATRLASWVGQAIAWLLIVTGIAMIFGVQVPFFGSGLLGGIWLAFIGWFLNSASAQSYRQIVVQDLLEDVPVERMMRTNPPTVRPDSSVSELVHDHVMGTDDHAFPVVEEEQLVGLVTLEDIRSLSKDEWETTQVRQIMTPTDELVVVKTDEDAAETMTKLMSRDVRQLPVMDNGHLAGLLRRRDIVKWLQLESESERPSALAG